MTEQKSSFRTILKLVVGLAVVAGAVWAAWFGFRSEAIVETVVRGPAVAGVTGSVIVHAKLDIFPLKTEVAGFVESCDLLDTKRPFKKNEELVKLDTKVIDRQIEELKRQHALEEKQLEVVYANVPKWKVAKEKLDTALRALPPKTELGEEIARLQDDLNKIVAEYDPARIVAKKKVDDAERLQSTGAYSVDDVNQLKRAFDAIETNLRVAAFNRQKAKADYEFLLEDKKLEREKMVIKAPFDGQVNEVLVRPGTLLGTGATVATLYANERLVVAKISEEDIASVKVGQTAKVRLLSYGKEFDAKVTEILPIAEENTQRYTVYLDVVIEPEKLVPFSTGEVQITVGRRENQPLIPRRALFRSNYVCVVKNGRVERRPVDVGFVSLTVVEITGHLEPGEQVIVEEVERFRDNQRVRTVVHAK